jgi:hypothetical protein
MADDDYNEMDMGFDLSLSLPPSSRLSPAYHAKVGEALLGFVSIGTAFANPSLPSNERASAIVY